MGFYKDENSEGRVEAREKVTGRGKYAAEYAAGSLCYAALVTSTIAAGSVKSISPGDALAAEGVIDVLTHENRPTVEAFSSEEKLRASRFTMPLLHTTKIHFKGQPIAVVVARTLEEAIHAATLVVVNYEKADPETSFNEKRKSIELKTAGKDRGSLEAWQNAPHTIDEEYEIAMQVHHPMEMHATIAEWKAADALTLYDKSQGVNGVQRTMGALLGLAPDKIEVISEFVGGGFGSGLRVWGNTLLAALAAKQVKRPVKLMLTRQQMFSLTGFRPQSWQRLKLGADADGNLLGVHHQASNATSKYENFTENITGITRIVYKFPNLKAETATVPLNISTPTWMRGPGDCTGDFAVETALDELCYKIDADPVELRLKNIDSKNHPETNLPWSSHFLPEALKAGAEKINWNERSRKPGQQREGDWLVGYGVAVGMWGAGRQNATVGMTLTNDGKLLVRTAMTDIGTGTGTALQNIAHEYTGIAKENISVELGNSNLPPAPSQGGSTGLSSISGATVGAAEALKKKIAALAGLNNQAFTNTAADQLVLSSKGISIKGQANASVDYKKLWPVGEETIDVEERSGPGEERQKYAFCSSAAHFVKLKVHALTNKVKIERMVSVADGGNIINNMAASNQISGAVVGGIGMALMEGQEYDHKLGSLIGDDLAGYHVAVQADAPIIDVSFINKPDPHINPTGSKGLGEVGIIGCAAAIANAIYNATGKRMRSLPITPDKLMMTKGVV